MIYILIFIIYLFIPSKILIVQTNMIGNEYIYFFFTKKRFEL